MSIFRSSIKSRRSRLPVRAVTEAEAAEAKSKVESLSKDPLNRRSVVWHQEVVDRYERQKAGPVDPFAMSSTSSGWATSPSPPMFSNSHRVRDPDQGRQPSARSRHSSFNWPGQATSTCRPSVRPEAGL